MLVLNITLKFDAADIDKAIGIMREACRITRTEPGCVSFDVMRVDDDPTTLVLHEVWADQAALDTHHKTELFNTSGAELRGLVKSRTLLRGAPIA